MIFISKLWYLLGAGAQVVNKMCCRCFIGSKGRWVHFWWQFDAHFKIVVPVKGWDSKFKKIQYECRFIGFKVCWIRLSMICIFQNIDIRGIKPDQLAIITRTSNVTSKVTFLFGSKNICICWYFICKYLCTQLLCLYLLPSYRGADEGAVDWWVYEPFSTLSQKIIVFVSVSFVRVGAHNYFLGIQRLPELW